MRLREASPGGKHCYSSRFAQAYNNRIATMRTTFAKIKYGIDCMWQIVEKKDCGS